ncbi:hypothetical protein EDC01DRAFT_640596 [Geopyxis carbonaria]|nr:hypothetical protein EDC01DRAFT_640596 [Geopyxis carbonaria]
MIWILNARSLQSDEESTCAVGHLAQSADDGLCPLYPSKFSRLFFSLVFGIGTLGILPGLCICLGYPSLHHYVFIVITTNTTALGYVFCYAFTS